VITYLSRDFTNKSDYKIINYGPDRLLSKTVKPKFEKYFSSMMLKDKVAVIYGPAGAIGSTTAHAFTREGAKVFLTRWSTSKLNKVEPAIISYTIMVFLSCYLNQILT
jgi:hypothetical protein